MELIIDEGACLVLFAYDLGFAVDLDKADGLLSRHAAWGVGPPALAPGGGQRASMRQRAIKPPAPGSAKRAPRYFDFKPAPLRFTRPCQGIEYGSVGGQVGGDRSVERTATSIEFVLFDFGAVSVAYTIPLEGPLASLLPLSAALYDNEALLADSRRRVAELLEAIGPAVTRPELSSFVEDFSIFQVRRHTLRRMDATPEAPPTLAEFAAANRAMLARVLRAERADLSAQEIDDALSCQIAYTTSDAAFIDWNAALIIDADPRDAATALEFANVELLEMRHLDDRLDTALDEVYLGFSPALGSLQPGRVAGRDIPRASLRRISALQIDAAILFEGVNNSLKLLGDQYLARLYRLAGQRFHLPEWDQSILRKLATLDGIYQKLSDRRANRRMEVLEWIIIALIAFEIVHSLI